MQLATGNKNCPASNLNILALGFGFPAGQNNGNVQSQTITSLTTGCQPSSVMQTYSYDSLNRLTQVAETGGSNAWQEGFAYDQYGNIMTDPSHTNVQAPAFMPSASTQIDALHNRVVKSTAAQPVNDVNYDDAGNVIGFPLMSVRMTYDAENRLTSSQTATGATVMYGYDGQGRRVSKTAAGLTTYYVYDTGDGLLAEYGGPSNVTVAGTVYQTEDHLGRTRAVTDAAGNIVSRSDYPPFGETIAGTATFNRNQIIGYGSAAGTSLAFTEHVEDTESGLDYFGARYFSGAHGRFTSPDAPFADQHPGDPQSWNMYPYVRNNPLQNTDPDGRDCQNGIAACGNYILGGLGAVGNAFTSGLINAPNHITNALISPFTNYRFGDIVQPLFSPANEDQRQGVEAANAVMLVVPLNRRTLGQPKRRAKPPKCHSSHRMRPEVQPVKPGF